MPQLHDAGPFSMKVETKAFNDHIKQFASQAQIEIPKAIKKFAFDLLKRIIMKSPVDTGRSRAGWFVALDKLGSGQYVAVGKTGSNVSAEAIREGRSKGGFIDHTKGVTDMWVEIINGVEYAIFLEYGHSQQAPYGMVRVSMREMRGDKLPKDMGTRLRKKWNRFYYG